MRHIMGVDIGGPLEVVVPTTPEASNRVEKRLREGDEYLIDPQ